MLSCGGRRRGFVNIPFSFLDFCLNVDVGAGVTVVNVGADVGVAVLLLNWSR